MKKLLLLSLLTLSCAVHADSKSFADGPLIKGFGKHTKVDQQLKLNTNSVMKVAFEDRAEFLGDTDFFDVPVERLISEA